MKITRFLLGALCCTSLVTSCIDDKINLSNISSEMQIGETLAIPIGNSEFNMEDLLAEHGAHMNSLYKLETQEGAAHGR